jgi:outer membrane protein assembly factor BamD
MRTDAFLPGISPDMPHQFRRLAIAGLLLATISACRADFKLSRYRTHEELFREGKRQFDRRKWDNAIAAFEKLTLELPARDTLLPPSFWYLASAHERQGEHLLAAQSFTKLVETFPDDSLSDNAALEAARSYRRLWRKPTLDAMYGETALATYNTLLGLYPSSPLIPVAQKELGELENWFAIKNYEAGMYYLRRKAYDSAILYFKDIVSRWPNSPKARDASLRLVEAYTTIRYREDASELCGQLRKQYAQDSEVRRECSGIPDIAPVAKPTSATPPSAPQPP